MRRGLSVFNVTALAVVLLVILLTPILIYRQREARILESRG